MSPRRAPRGIGRPPRLLEPEVMRRLLDAVRTGVPMELAAQHAGVSSRTIMRWMVRGRDEEASREDGGKPDPVEGAYYAIYLEIIKARADAATRNVGLLQKAAQGGSIIEETTRKYRDENGEMVTETSVKRTAPDWRAAAWYLERSHRSVYGKDALAVELSGPDGGPVQIGNPDDVASKVATNLAAALADARRLAIAPSPTDTDSSTDGDTVDGEIVG